MTSHRYTLIIDVESETALDALNKGKRVALKAAVEFLGLTFCDARIALPTDKPDVLVGPPTHIAPSKHQQQRSQAAREHVARAQQIESQMAAALGPYVQHLPRSAQHQTAQWCLPNFEGPGFWWIELAFGIAQVHWTVGFKTAKDAKLHPHFTKSAPYDKADDAIQQVVRDWCVITGTPP